MTASDTTDAPSPSELSPGAALADLEAEAPDDVAPAPPTSAPPIAARVVRFVLEEAFQATRLGRENPIVAMWFTATSILFEGRRHGIVCARTAPAETTTLTGDQIVGITIPDATLFTGVLCDASRWGDDRTTTVDLRLALLSERDGELRVTLGAGEDAAQIVWPCAPAIETPTAPPSFEGLPLQASELRDALALVQPYASRDATHPHFAAVHLSPSLALAESPFAGRIVRGFTLPPLTVSLSRRHAGDLVTILRYLGGEDARIAVIDDALVLANASTWCRVACAIAPSHEPVLAKPVETVTAPSQNLSDAMARILTQLGERAGLLQVALRGGPEGTLKLSVDVAGGTASLACAVKREAVPEGVSYPTRALTLAADGLRGGLGLARADATTIAFTNDGITFREAASGREVVTAFRRQREAGTSMQPVGSSANVTALSVSTSGAPPYDHTPANEA